jgi:hypothetical protein
LQYLLLFQLDYSILMMNEGIPLLFLREIQCLVEILESLTNCSKLHTIFHPDLLAYCRLLKTIIEKTIAIFSFEEIK